MAVLIAVTSDLHAGSTVALCPPRIELDDGGAYEASKAQLWIWRAWTEYWEWIERLRDEHRAELYMEFNGDLVEGNHHGTTQILSGNPTAQALVLDACMKIPLSLGPDRMFFVRGTESHVGVSASSEERIALGLYRDGRPVQKDPDTDKASWWRLRMEVEGVRLDFAHHGRVGTRPWTKPNVTMNLAAEMFFHHAAACERLRRAGSSEAEIDAERPPHVAVRSHLHQYVDTGSVHPVRVVQTPAWQLATAFIHRIAVEGLADVGGVALLVRDGAIDVIPRVQHPSRGAIWRPA